MGVEVRKLGGEKVCDIKEVDNLSLKTCRDCNVLLKFFNLLAYLKISSISSKAT